MLGENHNLRIRRSQDMALVAVGSIKGRKVLLAKPLTYMNLSGNAVKGLLKRYGIAPADCLVVADDFALELGRIRMKPKGSAGGHNGHKSIIASLGTSDYPRLKIGIGTPQGHVKDFVLEGFHRDEMPVVQEAIKRAAQACEMFVAEGMDAAMNWANSQDAGGRG